MTSEGLGEMFEGDCADMCAGKFPLMSMGCRAEGLACADPGARTPIGVSKNVIEILIFLKIHLFIVIKVLIKLAIWAGLWLASLDKLSRFVRSVSDRRTTRHYHHLH